MSAESEEDKEKSVQKKEKRNDNVGYIENQGAYFFSIIREAINNKLEKLEIPTIPTTNVKEMLSSFLYDASTSLNSQYPYTAQLSRTHGNLIASGSVLFVALSPIRRAPRRVYLSAVLGTAAVSYGFNELIKYKWYHAK